MSDGADTAADRALQGSDSDFASTAIEQMWALWIEPELVRRGETLDRAALDAAVVVMLPGRPTEVRLNNEVQWVARVPALRAVTEGEIAVEADIDLSRLESLRPAGVDHNAGWTGFVKIGGEVFVSFDFRRNRARARAMLPLARDYVAAASLAEKASLIRPATEMLHAAAELSIIAQMYLHDDSPTRSHAERRRLWRSWTELGNAPEAHSRCLARLAKARSAARYAGRGTFILQPELEVLLSTVSEMIDLAESRIGDPASDMPPAIDNP